MLREDQYAETRKISEAHFAYCHTCNSSLDSPYWNLSKCVWLHGQGCPEHDVKLYKLVDHAA